MYQFKNPFEDNDEEDTIITLDQPKTTAPAPAEHFVPLSQPGDSRQNSENSMFNPLDEQLSQAPQSQLDEFDDPPLLQDIGIDVELIRRRIVSIMSLQEASPDLIAAPDLSGPVLIAFLLGVLLLLGGKIHFSDILTYFILGNGAMYILFNFMAKEAEVSFYAVMSYLGYALLPMLILAVIGVVVTLNSAFGIISSLLLAGWSSFAAGGMISLVVGRSQGRILITYPLFLFYLSFALIIIF